MNKNKHMVLVPHDFTEVANNAVEHAVVIANSVGDDITIMHVIKSEKAKKDAEKQIKKIAEDINKKHKIKPKSIIRVGTIFTSIGEVAEEIEADLVIMGTHGVKGMQKFTGSWALKVIVSSQVPFIVVQEPPKRNKIAKIVFPVDFQKETKEKLNWVNYLSKYYQFKIIIFKRSEPGLKANIEKNMFFAKKYLKEHNIEYEIVKSSQKESFSIETINYAKEIDADLILIMTTKNIGFADYVLGVNEQNIIANSAKVPVMCVNPRPSSTIYSGAGAGMGI